MSAVLALGIGNVRTLLPWLACCNRCDALAQHVRLDRGISNQLRLHLGEQFGKTNRLHETGFDHLPDIMPVTRVYVERGWSDGMRALPELEHRELRAKASPRYGTAITEGLLMASRDGVKFKRWNEAFLRPGTERDGTWNYGHQYIAWHLVETKSALEGAPDELSLYAGENYWTGHSSALRRYTIRKDGFVSVSAPMKGGELITKPITFTGKSLSLNLSTSAAGGIQVELQDESEKPLPGYALADCPPVFGDSLDRKVTWTAGGDVSALAGKPIRLRFVLHDADLFSYKFGE